MVSVAHGSSFPEELASQYSASPASAGQAPLNYVLPELQNQQQLLQESTDMAAGLRALGATMKPLELDSEFSNTPAAYTYFGQFVDHDISFFDLAGRGAGRAASCDFEANALRFPDVSELRNKRGAHLELDSIYNSALMSDVAHFEIGKVSQTNNPIDDKDVFNDVPREPIMVGNSSDRSPRIADPRNDNNLIVSQMHVAFLRAHNALVDRFKESDTVQKKDFDLARKLLRQHYHHVLIYDFLFTIAQPEIVLDVLNRNDPLCDPDAQDFCLPLEFTAAAYRFGHSMIRNTYYYNDRLPGVSFNTLIPYVQMCAEEVDAPTLPSNRIIQWERFVARPGQFPEMKGRNPARLLGTNMVSPLFNLLDERGNKVRCEVNLAVMDLLRGYLLRLPTGQAVAQALIDRGRPIRKLREDEILAAAGNNKPQRDLLKDTSLQFLTNTPLFFYIMAEASQLGKGNTLGPVGSTIVAEVLIALVRRTPESILPKPGAIDHVNFVPIKNRFKLKDLLRLAGVLR